MDNLENKASALPETEENHHTDAPVATIPQTEEKEPMVSVKFNKEIKELSVGEAGELAQKGLKFDAISKEFETLKRIAKENGKSIPQYLKTLEERQAEEKKKELLEKCGGNEEIADRILNLEKEKDDYGFNELQKQFPNFEDISQLPYEVVENSKLKGTLLLDEFLRYRLRNEISAENELLKQKNLNNLSLGSQNSLNSNQSPEAIEFLNGLWK